VEWKRCRHAKKKKKKKRRGITLLNEAAFSRISGLGATAPNTVLSSVSGPCSRCCYLRCVCVSAESWSPSRLSHHHSSSTTAIPLTSDQTSPPSRKSCRGRDRQRERGQRRCCRRGGEQQKDEARCDCTQKSFNVDR
jgi:hypothetical protein